MEVPGVAVLQAAGGGEVTFFLTDRSKKPKGNARPGARPGPRVGREQSLRYHEPASWQVVVLGGLLVLPLMALLKLTEYVDWRFVLGGAVGVSLCAYGACVADKRKAQMGRWRTPEATLHFLELLGGWPGSFLAQRHFRHKIAKGSYQVVFWLIVAAYQVVAFEFLGGWRFSRELLR